MNAVETAEPFANRTILAESILLRHDVISSLTLNRKTLRSLQTPEATRQMTHHYVPEGLNLQQYRYDSLSFRKAFLLQLNVSAVLRKDTTPDSGVPFRRHN